MLFPERFNFNNNLFDDFFTDPVFNMTTTNRMSTDIKEKDNGYELAMEVPGFNKEDLKLDLEDGYLTISAEHNTTNEEKDNDDKKNSHFSDYCMFMRHYYGRQYIQMGFV